jgi:hypothetical protein
LPKRGIITLLIRNLYTPAGAGPIRDEPVPDPQKESCRRPESLSISGY